MKIPHSVVLSKINACVSERKVVCNVKQIGEKWGLSCNDQTKGLFHSSAGLKVVQVNADKASCKASFL